MTKLLAKLFKTTPEVISWALYDWANSTCSTTIMAGFFPAFFKDFWSIGVDATVTTARLGIVNSGTSVIVAALAPGLGALADRRGAKKNLCLLFMLISVAICFLLALTPKGEWFAALSLFGALMIAYNTSLIFYDALINTVAGPEEADRASLLGYGLGYLGGGLLFLVNILFVSKPEWFGLSGLVQGIQVSIASVGIWWFVFSYPLYKGVQEPKLEEGRINIVAEIWKALLQFFQSLAKLRKDKNLFIFMLSYWLYIDGVYTVITMSVDFGKSLNLATEDLMLALLLVQFIGFPFSLIFVRFAERWGCRIPILVSVIGYAIAVLLASYMKTSGHFFALAAWVGTMQGGVQALSRSLFAKMSPKESAGEYFGLFNLVGRFAAILGPLIVGIGAYITGNPGVGLQGLLILFVIGGVLLFKVKEPESTS